MTETFQQTQETPQPTTESMKKPDNKSTTVIVILLVLIFIVLGTLVAYQLVSGKKLSINPDQRDYVEETSVTDTDTDKDEDSATKTTETNDQTSTQTDTTKTNKPDIDKDLEGLDELDLSGIENDYAEDQLGDF